MIYRLRSGVDHEYKRKAIISSLLLVVSIFLLGLGANLLLNMRVSKISGDTLLTRSQQTDNESERVDPTSSNATSDATDTGGISTKPASAKQVAQASTLQISTPSNTPPQSIVPAPLPPVGGLGGGDNSGSCSCETVPNLVSPIVETVERVTNPVTDLLD